MAVGLVKKLITVFAVMMSFCTVLSGCNANLSPTPSNNTVFSTPAPYIYNTFEDGVGNFSFNAMLFVETAIHDLENSSYIGNMTKEQTSYYSELLLLGKMLKLDLSVINEINLLEKNEDYSDRADGKLLLSGYDGYRILQNSVIKFGYSDSENNAKNMSGELWFDKNYMTVQITEKLNKNVSTTTVAELVMRNNSGVVARYVKTVESDGQKTTKILYVLNDSQSCEIAYYEGNGDTSKTVSLDKLTSYTVNSVSFGIGTVICFDVKK